jgi:hypothetical protein
MLTETSSAASMKCTANARFNGGWANTMVGWLHDGCKSRTMRHMGLMFRSWCFLQPRSAGLASTSSIQCMNWKWKMKRKCTFLSHKHETEIEKEFGQKDVATCGRQANIIARTFPERVNSIEIFFFCNIQKKRVLEENCFCAFQLYPCTIKAPKI